MPQYEKVGVHLDALGENIASADKSVPDPTEMRQRDMNDRV